MRSFLAAAVCAALMSACAQAPREVEAGYTTPLLYERYSCYELGIQATRVSSSAAQLSGYQRRRANWDAAKVITVIFVPSVVLDYGLRVEGNGPLTYELARLKGELLAIQQSAITKGCGFEYRPY